MENREQERGTGTSRKDLERYERELPGREEGAGGRGACCKVRDTRDKRTPGLNAGTLEPPFRFSRMPDGVLLVNALHTDRIPRRRFESRKIRGDSSAEEERGGSRGYIRSSLNPARSIWTKGADKIRETCKTRGAYFPMADDRIFVISMTSW